DDQKPEHDRKCGPRESHCVPPRSLLNSTLPFGESNVAISAGFGPRVTLKSSLSTLNIWATWCASGCSARRPISVTPFVAVTDGCGDDPQSMKYGISRSARIVRGSV